MKKTILVPTDFSPVAQNAYIYARGLAKHFQHAVTLLHAYRPALEPAAPITYIPPIDDLDELKKFFFGKLEEKRLDPAAGQPDEVETSCRVEIGFPSDEIESISSDAATAFVVMGTKGHHNMAERVLGSVTSDTLQRARCPMIAVPEGISFKEPKAIVCPIDASSANAKSIHHVIEFASTFKAKIHFVNVNDKVEMGEKILEKLLDGIMDEKSYAVTFTTAAFGGHTHLGDAINWYVEENNIDMVAMVTKHRNFFDRLFHHSHTKELALQVKVPLLVFHV